MQTPAMITDMVPFIIGTLSPEQRSNLSWSFSDMFDWATYEEKELVPELALSSFERKPTC